MLKCAAAMTAVRLMLATLLLQMAATQSLQMSPSVGSGGSFTFPLFSVGNRNDQWPAESSSSSSQQVVTVLPPPNQISQSTGYSPFASGFQPVSYLESNNSKIDYAQYENYLGDEYASGTSSRVPGYAAEVPPEDSRNHTSRFFTLNTSRQTLDLGLSFTVPFLSLPMTSLLSMGQNIGDNTYAALNSLLAINWPSVALIGVAILGATLLLPQLASWIATATGTGTAAGGSSYTSSYGRTIDRGDTAALPVAPFTSILNQLDDALAQYDLDSTSCMQRAVCSYVAGSEDSVQEGDPDSSEMIVAGLARSKWMQTLLGQGSLAKAVELGRSGGQCQRQFPKCPFSLGGILRFLVSYASLTS